jgi:hypothetical protein
MADNILKGIIKIEAPGIEQTATRVSQAIGKTEQSLRRMAPVSNEATGSLINLGRVVQDAPFGFLGIANNLNPLIEGFSRTAKSAGGFTGAMKAIGKSLVGAGGLSLAVSLVSTGLLLFGDKLFGTSKAAKEADEATQKLAQNLSQQAVKLTSLVGLVQNVNVKYEEKQKALRAINQEYKTYLDDLGIEEVSANNVADAYERIIDSLIRQAVVKGLQEEITKAVEETAKKIIEIEKAEQKRRQASQATAQANKFELTTEQAVEQQLKNMNPVVKDGALALQDRNAEVRTGIQVENTYAAVIKRVKDELFSTLAPMLQLTENFEDLNINLDKVKKTAAKEVKIPELVLQSSFSEPENLPTLSELTSEVLKLYNRAGSVLGKEFVEGFNNATTSAGAESDAAVFMVQGLEKQFAKEFEKFGLNFFSTAKIDLSKSFFVNSETLTKQLEDIARAFQSAQLTADIASTSFDAAFDALLNGQNALQAIGNALKQLVADLIKATVQALIFKAVTNLLIPGSAAGGAAAGAAGIGRLFGGGVAGLSGNSGFSGGITVAVQGELVGRGGSLVGVITRAGATNGRSFVG